MSGIACGCASEICAIMGCQRVAEIKQRFGDTTGRFTPIAPIPLTADDVRRIVREEVANALRTADRATKPVPD